MEDNAKRTARFGFSLTPRERPDFGGLAQHAGCTRVIALRPFLRVMQSLRAFVRSYSRGIRVHRQSMTGADCEVAV
ncbi:MAG TPA: hypothetical protein VMV23_07595 [Candidatus Nanopelagicaceae bacterium]|nr:hypothetical protein [Candidatus Nanopelagicaceae bacterium]HVA07659.1 hypothetical protein [Acidimicrobiales bacterium]